MRASAVWTVLDLLLHVALTGLPLAAGVLLAIRLGVSDRLLVLGVGLCGLLVTGYLTFWVFLADPQIGTVFSAVLTAALLIAVVGLGAQLRSQLRPVARDLLKPALVWIAASLAILCFGSAYVTHQPITIAARTRFSGQLPIDNDIPLVLANALDSSRRPLRRPLYAEWNSSDRPPLQAGIYLSQETFLPGQDRSGFHYQIVGVVLQGLWIFGAWGLLAAVEARARLVALILTATLFSGFVLVNTYYAWPKLFPAAYLLLLAAVLLTPAFRRLRTSAVAGATAGALAGAALLAHEGSLFALIAFAVVMLITRRMPSKRFVLAAIAVLIVTQGSWMLYGRVLDPPGDQVARALIANQPRLYAGDPRPLVNVVYSAYRKKSLATIARNKLDNLGAPFTGADRYLVDATRLVGSYFSGNQTAVSTRHAAVLDLRALTFFYLLPSVGFLSLGFLAWLVVALRRRRRPDGPMHLAGMIWLFLGANLVTWALLLFGPSATVLHQGTYVTGLLTFTGCVIGLWELSPWLATAVVGLQVGLTAIVYGLNSPFPAATPPQIDTRVLAVGVGSLLLTAAAIAWIAIRPEPEAGHAPGPGFTTPG